LYRYATARRFRRARFGPQVLRAWKHTAAELRAGIIASGAEVGLFKVAFN
jgi:hypothetical protein